VTPVYWELRQAKANELLFKQKHDLLILMKQKILTALGIIGAIVSVEIFRAVTGIPVTIIDITLFPISVIFIVGMAMILFKKENKNKKKRRNRNATPSEITFSWVKRLGYIAGAILMLALGVWGILEGIEQPFKLFTGVKGPAHGYTLAAIGVVLIIMALIALYQFIFKVRSNSQASNIDD